MHVLSFKGGLTVALRIHFNRPGFEASISINCDFCNRFLKIDYQKSNFKNRLLKIDYQKSNFNNRLSKIEFQKSIIRSIVKDRSRVNRKSTVKNRLLKIDLQKSILYWMHTPIRFCLNFVANGVPYKQPISERHQFSMELNLCQN